MTDNGPLKVNVLGITQAISVFIHKNATWICSVILVATLVPFAAMWDESCVIIHDNLDMQVPWRVVVSREGKMFASDSTVNQVMNGVPRNVFTSGFHITSFFFSVLSPFTAYLLNHCLVHLVAFLGMLRLLRSHIIPTNPVLSAGLSLTFALLPFYSTFGLTIAGQPLLLSAILTIAYRKARPQDWVIILAFPFASSFVQVGIFIVFVLCAWLIFDLCRNQRVNYCLLATTIVLSVLYLAIERSLIVDILCGGRYTSHRVEYSTWAFGYGIREVFYRTINNFINGQYHAHSLHSISLFLAIPLGVLLSIRRREYSRLRLILGLLFLSFLFSLALGIQGWRFLIPVKNMLPLLYAWQIGRFHWLHPVLWFVVIALALGTISRSNLGGRYAGSFVASLLLLLQCGFVASHNEELVRTSEAFVLRCFGKDHWCISYSEFYSEDLFERIAQHISKPKKDYRVASIGLHPGIAAYNGFYTLDLYAENYPLEYKHQFRRIMKRELEKSQRWRKYFDGWGNRCYLFSSELQSTSIRKSASTTIRNLELDTSVFAAMGGEYILSGVQIQNSETNYLVLDGIFELDSSPWRIWLYRVMYDNTKHSMPNKLDAGDG